MKLICLFRVAGITLTGITLFSASCAGQVPEPASPAPPKTYSALPPMVIDSSKQYVATIET